MHETKRKILEALPGTKSEIAKKTGLSINAIGIWLNRMVTIKQVKTLGKQKRSFREGPGETNYGKLEDEIEDPNNWFKGHLK